MPFRKVFYKSINKSKWGTILMKKILLLSTFLLFIVGSVLFLGAYFIFNQYSVSGSHSFQYYHETWQFPETPLELGEGDKITVKTSKVGNFDGHLFIINTNGKQVLLRDIISNSSIYYYIQTNDFYYFYIDIFNWSPGSGPHSVTLNITVVSRAPNLLFLLIGIIVLLAGAVTIPVVFLYKTKNEKKE